MKYILLCIGLLITLSLPALALSQPAGAVNVFTAPCGKGSANGTPEICKDTNPSKNPIINIIKAAISILAFITGTAAVIGILVSGIRFIVSSGDPGAMASARTGLIYSLVGLAVAATAASIVAFVLNGT